MKLRNKETKGIAEVFSESAIKYCLANGYEKISENNETGKKDVNNIDNKVKSIPKK